VKCMHQNGINKFFWPSPKEDICWYCDGHNHLSDARATGC
jgi:hypothetical protein